MRMDFDLLVNVLLVSVTPLPKMPPNPFWIHKGHATALRNISGTTAFSSHAYFSKSPEHRDELCYTRLLPPYASYYSNLHQDITSLCLSLFQPTTKYSHPMFLSFPIFKLGVRKFTSALLFGSVLPIFHTRRVTAKKTPPLHTPTHLIQQWRELRCSGLSPRRRQQAPALQ